MTNQSTRPIIVGIAGGSASGKSTFADKLREALISLELTVVVFHMDRYAVADKSTGPQVQLHSGETIFDWNRQESYDPNRLIVEVDEVAIGSDCPNAVIVEGLMALELASVRALLDVRIFIELDADLRALRRMLRDMAGGRASRDPEFIRDYYAASARAGHALYVEPSRVHADIILRGDADFDRTAPMIASVVQARRRLTSAT